MTEEEKIIAEQGYLWGAAREVSEAEVMAFLDEFDKLKPSTRIKARQKRDLFFFQLAPILQKMSEYLQIESSKSPTSRIDFQILQNELSDILAVREYRNFMSLTLERNLEYLSTDKISYAIVYGIAAGQWEIWDKHITKKA